MRHFHGMHQQFIASDLQLASGRISDATTTGKAVIKLSALAFNAVADHAGCATSMATMDCSMRIEWIR